MLFWEPRGYPNGKREVLKLRIEPTQFYSQFQNFTSVPRFAEYNFFSVPTSIKNNYNPQIYDPES